MKAILNKQNVLLLLVILLVTVSSYYTALDGPYFADDYPNLIENKSIKIKSFDWASIKEAVLSSPSSQFYRPISMFSFTLNYYYSEDASAFSIKLTNLILHLLCGIGFYILSRQILFSLDGNSATKNELVALSIASFWLLHPLFVTTVLYAIQRMAILSTLFVVFGCIIYIKFRENLQKNNTCFYWLISSIIIFTLLSFFSKENGALLCGFLLLIEYFLFQSKYFSNTPSWQKLFLKIFLIIPVLFIFIYLARSYAMSPAGELEQYFFSLNDKVLTEFRVLWKYVGWLFLIDPKSMGFLHDDVIISSSLFQPITTFTACISWIIVLTACIWFLKKRHLLTFGILWFLWGHILESTVLPLVPVYEHRNYLPGFGLILIFVWSLAKLATSINLNRILGYTIFAIIVFIFPLRLLQERVASWEDEKKLAVSILKEHPGSAATYMWAGMFLSDTNDYENALIAIRQGEKLRPEETAFLMTESIIRCRHKPDEVFSHELKNKLNSEFKSIKPTMLFRVQLSSMIDACTHSPVNSDALHNFYSSLIKSKNIYTKFLAYYGRGTTFIHKGEKELAVNDWNKAYLLYPMKTWLKEAIEAIEAIEAKETKAINYH